MVTINGWKTISPSKMPQMFEIHVQKNYSDQHWYEIHSLFVNSTYKFHTVTGKWSENFRLSPYELVTIWKNIIHLSKSLMSPSEHVTIWKKYSFSYQYEYVTIWYVTIWIIFISVTILVWNFQMVTDMNPSYQASIRWHLSPYGGSVWKFFIPVTKKPVQMVTVW